MKLKSLLIAAITLFTLNASAQAPQTSSVEVFKTCMDELQDEIKRVKKVMIKDFNLKIRQKDILVYGPYQISDQYFKVDYMIYAPNPSKVTAEFELYFNDADEDEELTCSEVRFHDYVY